MESLTSILSRRHALLARDNPGGSLSPVTVDLIISLMVLIFIGLLIAGALYLVRKIRKSRAVKRQTLPRYNQPRSHRRRLTIATTPYDGRASSVFVYDEKSSLTNNSASPPQSPDNVPEIRITFPDEQDESGRRMSGRVVIVRLGEKGGIGLEPIRDEQLPAYQKESKERFHSLDMERIGGLREKRMES